MNILFESALARGCGILALVPAVYLITACSEEVVEQAAVIRPINILTVGGLAGGAVLKYPAEIRPIQNAELAFEVPGRLIELPVVEGEDVQAGQQLASLDPADFNLSLMKPRPLLTRPSRPTIVIWISSIRVLSRRRHSIWHSGTSMSPPPNLRPRRRA